MGRPFQRLSLRGQLALLLGSLLLVWMGFLALDTWAFARGLDPHRFLWLRAAELGVGLLVLALGLLLGRAILQGFARDVHSLVELAQTLGLDEGSPLPEGELGTLARALVDMRVEVLRYETDLRETLERLRDANQTVGRREAFLRALVDSAPVAIITLDPDWTVTGFNPAAERLLGYEAAEVIGQASPSLWADPGEQERFFAEVGEELGRPVAAGRSFFEALDPAHPLKARERIWIRKDGRPVPVMLAVTALMDSGGNKAGALGVATDLSVVKALEEELRKSEAEAQAANRAKSAFLATMTHEVRTPLIGVMGMLELLSLSQLDPEQRRAVNVIHQSAQSLLQILGSILDFSRIEAGLIDLVPEPMDLRQMAEELAFVFSRAAGSKGLAFSWEVGQEVAAAHVVDGLRLRQILTNLLSNAVKFTPQGSVEFRIQAGGAEGGAQGLAFKVRDTGIGVSLEQRQRLFQPFAQVEATTTRRYGGTGLGLAICRRIVDAMEGHLDMESALGQGTTMTLEMRLPVADPAEIPHKEREEAPSTELRVAPTVEEALREGTLILLAEDHPTNRLVLQHQIRRAGYASEASVDGEQALGRWSTGRYGLVLTDVHMPGLDGYELTAAIRDLERAMGRPRTPILAITANVLVGEAERCLDAGMDDYLSKPVTIPELSRKLAQWLPRAASPPAPELEREGPREVSMEILLDLANGDAGAATGILADFMDSAREDLAGMDQGATSRDAVGLARHAHRLKGAAAMVGALPLAKVAAELEAVARNKDWPQAERVLIQVHRAADDLDRFAKGPAGGA